MEGNASSVMENGHVPFKRDRKLTAKAVESKKQSKKKQVMVDS